MLDHDDLPARSKSGESLTPPSRAYSGGNHIVAEVNGFNYVLHMDKTAVGYLKSAKELFSRTLKIATDAFEALEPMAILLEAYCTSELIVIQAMSQQSPNGQVKVYGVIPLPPVGALPDPDYTPPDGWNPPPRQNDYQGFTVNSINIQGNEWFFTADNVNLSYGSPTFLFSTPPDGNTFQIIPENVNSSWYGFPALQGRAEFKDTLDTCARDPRDGTWWVFNGRYAARVNPQRTEIINGPEDFLRTFRGLRRIMDLEYGEEEKRHWEYGISCATINEDGILTLIAGNNRMATLRPQDDMDFVHIPGFQVPGLTCPGPISNIWDGLSDEKLSRYIQQNRLMKALCRVTPGSGMGYKGRGAWLFVFQDTLIMHVDEAKAPWVYNWMMCPSDKPGSNEWWYGWQAMAACMGGGWSHPRC
ncbi:hypothetical protein ACIBKX_37190 [Streptomyces sp. NPDC050658]|uniref:hypothetical protein n=1 Tax=unclassified Streptomyces TaxID=2593676 RepID=UPI00341A3E45